MLVILVFKNAHLPFISLPGQNKSLCLMLTLFTGADSVKYLTVEGLVSAVQEGIAFHIEKDKINSNNKSNRKAGHCTACLTGKYPVELEW